MNKGLADTVAWMREKLEENPEASVDDIARWASAERVNLSRPMITKMRQSLREPSSYDAPLLKSPAVTVTARKRCTRCNIEGHWVSECLVPVAAPPAPEEEPMAYYEDPLPREASPAPAPPVPAPAPFDSEEARKRTQLGTVLRRQVVNELLDPAKGGDPGMDPQVILGRVKERFGVGISWDYVYETCRLYREAHNLPQLPQQDKPHSRRYLGSEKLPTFGVEYEAPEEDEEEEERTLEEELAWLAKQAGEIMRAHDVHEVKLSVVGTKARWSFVVSRSGSGETDV